MANAAEYSNYRQAATGQPVPKPYGNVDTDWYRTILRNAMEQSHSLSVSGGTDKSSFLFNVGYMDDQGIIVGNTFKRLTVRLNSDYTITDNLKLSALGSYSNSINQNGFNNIDIDPNGIVDGHTSAYHDAYRAAPTVPSKIEALYGNTS